MALCPDASYRLVRGSGHRPAWAFDESTGSLGAARAVLATAALFIAIVLPLWVVSTAENGNTSSSQPAAVAGAGFSVGRGGTATERDQATVRQGREDEDDRDEEERD
jgi:hypothetical protein